MENEQWFSKNTQNVTMDLGPADDFTVQGNLPENGDETDNSEPQTKFGNGIEMNKRIQQVQAAISEPSRKNIENILDQVKTLNPVECMLLYLKLPTEYSNVADPLRQPLNPLGSRSEISQTIMWIRTHLEEDPELSLPKQDVYNEYYAFCGPNKIKPLSTADFGKVMKQVYPRVRPRRLGTRGNSRYCYAGLRRRLKLDTPRLPDLFDKPQSSEIMCTSADLLAATWAVIKEWSEQQLEMQFPSVQALASYLVLNLSVGMGTDAATLITSAAKNSFNKGFSADLLQSVTSCNSKHREAQLQLQRKIHQKNEINKEQKRKMQLQNSKTEHKPRNKRCKLQNQSSIITSTNTSPTTIAIGDIHNTNSPPMDLQSVCDKSIDFSSLQTLPDFSSFQKATDQQCDYANEKPSKLHEETACDYVPKSNTKVPIPRLNSNLNKFSPLTSPKRGKLNKYKEIQPKPEPIDGTLTPQLSDSVNLRSHESGDIHESYRKRVLMETFKSELMDVNIPLTRERLISISEIDKSALDDYLGTGNSQEQEEELAKYFENKDRNTEQEYAAKLVQLRNLLLNQQNGETGTPESRSENTLSLTSLLSSNLSAFAKGNFKNLMSGFLANPTQQYQKENDQMCLSLSARRKVTFDNIHQEDVPASPDTRRKNFNFMPISPGPISPGEKYSKCSSANVSPFVSPRSTPISRGKTSFNANVSNSYVGSNVGIFNLAHTRMPSISTKPAMKIKQETDTHPDCDISSDLPTYLPMSAPPSPRQSKNNNLLHKLLNSNNKVPYSPTYLQSRNVHSTDPLSCEISQFFSSNIQHINMEPTYRSQSVPLHQMSFKSCLDSPITQNAANVFSFPTSANVNQLPVNEEINEFNQFPTGDNLLQNMEDSNSEICENLNLPPNGFNNVDLAMNRQQYGDSFDEQSVSTNSLPHISNLRIMSRSQSIDMEGNGDLNPLSKFPSRSVPGTPIPNYNGKLYRSYPTTPILTNPNFSYNHGHDYLLNGQPIKDSVPSSVIKTDMGYLQGSESNEGLYNNDMYNINDANINSDIPFGEKNHFNFDGNLTDTNINVKRHIGDINSEINGNDYHHKTSNIDNS